MRLKVLVVPDKFKGTLGASSAAAAIAKGWHRARPADVLETLPMSDGGDGFGEVLSGLLGARAQTVRTVDAAGRPCEASWWWEPRRKIAIVESARVIGLAMLPAGRFHPFKLDTFGLGAVIRAAEARRARRLIIGIGGSATNDGGFGLARSLGWEFQDRNGKPILRWVDLDQLSRIVKSAKPLRISQVLVAVDVQNPLLGPRGATRIYGPQKGMRPRDFAMAERALRRLSSVAQRGMDCRWAPGAGAAGGLGFGLAVFTHGRLERGFQLFSRLSDLDRRLRDADLVITGEGSIDHSSLMGKGVGEIARKCRFLGIPCLALGGLISLRTGERRQFTRMAALRDLTLEREAKRRPAFWLRRLARRLGREWRNSNSG